MATEKQIKANRKNSQKSTGPKTAGGKAAVSQDAVKHGLFADSVVAGETEAEYEAFHGELLAELAPRGVVELLPAERVVSLWWRLIRAEHMQNQAIEDKIGRYVTNNTSRSCRKYYFRDQGIRPDEPGFDLDGLPLGRIGNNDFASARILERMMLYERRIESSLNKAMKELQRLQKIRRIEWKKASQKKAASTHAIPKAFGFEAATRAIEKHSDLKKQSQYDRSAFSLGVLMDGVPGSPMESLRTARINLKKQSQFAAEDAVTNTLEQRDYGNNPAAGNEENKANRSQNNVNEPVKEESVQVLRTCQ